MSPKDPKDESDPNDLIGFKDFLEAEKAKPVAKGAKNMRADGFELLTFLEQDAARVQKLVKIFEEKSYVLKKYSQAPNICQDLESRKLELKDQLAQKFEAADGPLMKNLAELFKAHFS